MRLPQTGRTVGVLLLAGMLAACSDPVPAAKDACPESAQVYWKKFRTAVMSDDLNAVAKATHFPLEVRGQLDDSPTKMVSRDDLGKYFPQLLNTELGSYFQQPVITPPPTSMKELVKATSQLHSSFCSEQGDQFGVGAWVFLLKPAGWRFVQAFVNESG